MDLKTAIRKASNSNVSPTAFYALLSDFGAFEEEEPWVKSITKTICDKNYHQQLPKLTLPDKSNSLRIQDIIYKLSSQYGYEAGKVSTVLHKLALGMGSVTDSFDWNDEFSPTSRTGKTNTQPHTTAAMTCPGCGLPFYKIYSTYCAFCGSKRQ